MIAIFVTAINVYAVLLIKLILWNNSNCSQEYILNSQSWVYRAWRISTPVTLGRRWVLMLVYTKELGKETALFLQSSHISHNIIYGKHPQSREYTLTKKTSSCFFLIYRSCNQRRYISVACRWNNLYLDLQNKEYDIATNSASAINILYRLNLAYVHINGVAIEGYMIFAHFHFAYRP